MSDDGGGTADGPDQGAATGYDEWLEAVGAGEAFALECPDGHASLPPRRVCPECGATDLAEVALPAEGSVETFAVMHTATPAFADDVPYVSAIAGFGPVRLTGVLRGVDPEDVSVGQAVTADVDVTETGGDPVLVFRPA